MNVIIAYLETMFSAYPRTPRMLEAKAELQAMMEDAYTSHIGSGMSENEAVGKVITEFGNLDELAPVLGIAAEIAPADPTGAAGGASSTGGTGDGSAEPARKRTPYPAITLDEAQAFAETRRATQPRLAAAIALFVLCPVSLLIGVLLGDDNRGGDDRMTGLGLVGLLVVIAIGVMIVISVDRKRAVHKRINDYRFSRSPAVTAWARELEHDHARRRGIALQVAVTLWILAAAPVLLTALMFPDLGGEGNGALVGVMGTLCFVAIGLLVFLPNNWASEVADAVTKLRGALHDGETLEDDDEDDTSLVGVIAAFYWPLLTVIFLAWGLIGDAWDRAWIVWPIGAVLFGAIAAGTGAWESYRKNRR